MTDEELIRKLQGGYFDTNSELLEQVVARLRELGQTEAYLNEIKEAGKYAHLRYRHDSDMTALRARVVELSHRMPGNDYY